MSQSVAKSVNLGTKIFRMKETTKSRKIVQELKQDWRVITVETQLMEKPPGVTHKMPRNDGTIVTLSGATKGAAGKINVKIIVEI